MGSYLIVLLPPLLNQYVRTYSDVSESHIFVHRGASSKRREGL